MKKVTLIALLSILVVNGYVMAKEASPAKAEAAVVTTVQEIKGMVFDKMTNESLAGASVIINGKKVYTDLDGNFSIPAQTGNCEIRISMISYEDKVVTVNLNGQSALKIELNQR